MRGKLEVLFGGVLLASAMLLSGCVAQTADDDADVVDEAASSLTVGEVDGDGDPATPSTRAAGTATSGDAAGSFKGNDCTSDPQPNPWRPDGDPNVKPQQKQR